VNAGKEQPGEKWLCKSLEALAADESTEQVSRRKVRHTIVLEIEPDLKYRQELAGCAEELSKGSIKIACSSHLSLQEKTLIKRGKPAGPEQVNAEELEKTLGITYNDL